MKYFTFILILSLFGCSISSKKSETPYSGQNIESKDVARKYYGVTTKKLGENEFQLYVVVRLVTNWDLKIKAAYMRKASELCNDAFDLEVFRSDLHGRLGADLDNQWSVISQKAILNCARPRN